MGRYNISIFGVSEMRQTDSGIITMYYSELRDNIPKERGSSWTIKPKSLRLEASSYLDHHSGSSQNMQRLLSYNVVPLQNKPQLKRKILPAKGLCDAPCAGGCLIVCHLLLSTFTADQQCCMQQHEKESRVHQSLHASRQSHHRKSYAVSPCGGWCLWVL